MKNVKYIDSATRITFRWNLVDLGYSYHLERRVKFMWGYRWKNVAWTYYDSHTSEEELIEYLFWYERKHRQPSRSSILT